MTVSRPSGSDSMNPQMLAISQQWLDAFRRGTGTDDDAGFRGCSFGKKYGSCGTMPKRWRTSVVLQQRRSSLPKLTLPVSGSYRRRNIFAKVLLPEPDGPTNATRWPKGIVRLIPRSTGVSGL